MQYRKLGRTNLDVSAVSFGAGPVASLLTGDNAKLQRATVQRALDAGVNWFDTAATYGQGKSERNLGRALAELDGASAVHVATKVRLAANELDDPGTAIEKSVRESLARLGMAHVTLLQLHNAITARRGDEPTSLTPHDVLRPGGVREAFERLRDARLVSHLGLTGIGQAPALAEVVDAGHFDTLQVPYHLLNLSAGGASVAGGLDENRVDKNSVDKDYGNIIGRCHAQSMGIFAIRVLAGGALAGRGPSQHTLTTPFFPLAQFQADRQRAERIAAALPAGGNLKELAVRFVLDAPGVASAIVGFGSPDEVDEIVGVAARGALDDSTRAALQHACEKAAR